MTVTKTNYTWGCGPELRPILTAGHWDEKRVIESGFDLEDSEVNCFVLSADYREHKAGSVLVTGQTTTGARFVIFDEMKKKITLTSGDNKVTFLVPERIDGEVEALEWVFTQASDEWLDTGKSGPCRRRENRILKALFPEDYVLKWHSIEIEKSVKRWTAEKRDATIKGAAK